MLASGDHPIPGPRILQDLVLAQNSFDGVSNGMSRVLWSLIPTTNKQPMGPSSMHMEESDEKPNQMYLVEPFAHFTSRSNQTSSFVFVSHHLKSNRLDDHSKHSEHEGCQEHTRNSFLRFGLVFFGGRTLLTTTGPTIAGGLVGSFGRTSANTADRCSLFLPSGLWVAVGWHSFEGDSLSVDS